MDFLKRGQGLIGTVAMALVVAGASPAAAVGALPPYDWTGLYVGGYAGGPFGSRAKAQDNGGGPFTAYNDGHGHTWRYDLSSSFIGDAQVGYNFQIPSIVLGLENEVGYISQTGSRADPVSLNGDTKSSTEVGRWFDVLGGRVGVAFDRWLVYAKGGVAFTHVSSKVVDSCITGSCGGGAVSTSGGESVVTGAGGGGAEYASPTTRPINSSISLSTLTRPSTVPGQRLLAAPLEPPLILNTTSTASTPSSSA